VKQLVERVVEGLLQNFEGKIAAVAMFGSSARGESTDKSDMDFFVVVKDYASSLERRLMLYRAIHDVVARDVTVIDVDEEDVFRQDLEITSLLLNIAYDGKILYDPEGRLKRLFEKTKEIVAKLGLERRSTKDGKYWWKAEETPLKTVEV